MESNANEPAQTTTDGRLPAIRALTIEGRLSWLVNGVVLAMFGPGLFLSWNYPEPLGASVKYGGLLVLVVVQAYRWRVRRRQRVAVNVGE